MAMTLSGTSGITYPNSSTMAQSAGLGSGGQTWTANMAASTRFLNTTYTNSTGYPIMVTFVGASSGGAYDPQAIVAGVNLGRTGAVSNNGAYATFSFIVPNGQTYSVNASAFSLVNWNELR